MTDEKFAFISDVREKAQTGRSSHNRKPHAGKGGRVRLQSDNLTRKELLALNGETKTYRMNDPMGWKEFKQMPDDLKIAYIKAIREKFNAPDVEVAKMFGINRITNGNEMRRLGLGRGRAAGGNHNDFDRKGFNKWAYGEATQQPKEPKIEVLPVQLDPLEEICTPAEEVQPAMAVPNYGTMAFTGKPAEIFATVEQMLKDGTFYIMISWDGEADG